MVYRTEFCSGRNYNNIDKFRRREMFSESWVAADENILVVELRVRQILDVEFDFIFRTK